LVDLFCIADDLTGALECGALLASYGLEARVTTRMDPGATVVDTESRHLSAEDAAERVRAVVEARDVSAKLIYKKTDSTLRGNIGAELAVLEKSFPRRRVIYVPAYPAVGRTVRGGQLLVNGVPVHQTIFANDPLNPISSSFVRDHLAADTRAEVLDGVSDADIEAAALSALQEAGEVIVAGPGAIAGALARQITGGSSRIPRPVLPANSRCLVVNGSLHPVAAAQVDHARKSGLFGGSWFLLEHFGSETGVERARAVGDDVKRVLNHGAFDAIIVFGGDTAYGIHEALGSHDFDSRGELMPAVPMSRSNGLYWITKAGGFGQVDLLERLNNNNE
jgi:uncharacterized protein YgbK (DUF1537 family)